MNHFVDDVRGITVGGGTTGLGWWDDWSRCNRPDPPRRRSPRCPVSSAVDPPCEPTGEPWRPRSKPTRYGIASQQNNVSWDQLFSDPYTSAVHNFQIRISEGDPTANDKADGFGWKYVNSDLHGTTGAMYTAGEEPNLPGSLGVGFDIWDNGGQDNNANTSSGFRK